MRAITQVRGAIVGQSVRALAWVWTRVLTERLRVAAMWWLNEKVSVRVVAVVPGPRGSVLALARRGRLRLPSTRLGRDGAPDATVARYLLETCALRVETWVPVAAVRRRGSRLDAVFVAKGVHPTRPALHALNRRRGAPAMLVHGRAAWVEAAVIGDSRVTTWLQAASA